MKKQSIKGEALYQKLKSSREQLVKKYQANGEVSYDEATGLRGPLGAATAVVNGVTFTLTKSAPAFQPDAVLGATATETLTVPDFEQIKLYNIARGVPSGTMLDALKKFGTDKVITLAGNAQALGFGGFLIGDVSCMLKVTSDIRSIHGGIVPARPATAADAGVVWAGGGPDRTRNAVETATMQYRGKFKVKNYRGTPEMLNHPVSIWATTDKSRQSMFLFGVNSLIRFYGENVVLDLNGFRISHHERPNRFAAFACLVDLADGHFLGLSSKGAKNAHIFCSKGTGVLGRNNHFAIRGHLVDGLLVENVISGSAGTLNEGSYFGTAILNRSSNIVMKDVQQNMVNKAVALSSAGLSFYAQLVNQELLFGFFETVSSWNSLIAPSTPKSSAFPWLKWEDKSPSDPDTFGNGKKTPYPVLKTESELAASLGVNSSKAASIFSALRAAQVSYSKSMKSADDMYIQVHTASSRNHPAFIQDSTATGLNIPHTTNAVVVNPSNSEGLRYPDSVGYGFRIGASEEGVGRLADAIFEDSTGLPRNERQVKNIHIADSSFKDMELSMMEAVSLGIPGKGLTKTFNGMALRPFGYSNSLSPAQGISASLILMSKKAIETASPASALEQKPVDSFDTAGLAAQAANAVISDTSKHWTSEKAHGLYKGNDVSEASLAAITAIGLLRKYFPQASQLLSGIDNSAVDVGILALRKSMLTAISAKTAAHVGLRGGFNGHIFGTDATAAGSGSLEIYPFMVSEDETISIDKDSEWQVQQVGNPATPAQIKANRRLSQGYTASVLPPRSSSIMRLKMISADEMALVRCDDMDTPVTYQECADLLDFQSTAIGAPASMTAPVRYKIVRNVDGQNHVHKGSFGVRMDEAQDCSITNVLVKDYSTEKSGPATRSIGSKSTQIEFNVNSESEPQSDVQKITGVSINACEDVEIYNVEIQDCIAGSEIFGVEIAGNSESVSIVEISGKNLTGPEKATVLRVAGKTSGVKVKEVSGESLSSSDSSLSPVVQIESATAKLS
jgi:hypothetical protein